MNRLGKTAISLLMAGSAMFAQTPPAKRAPIPRAADGHPSLEGIWTNATLTPLQRPVDLAAKAYFTPEEAAAWEKQILIQSDTDNQPRKPGDPGSYNAAFMDRGNHIEKSRRTSLIIDPPDGRIPPFTADAQAKIQAFREYAAQHPADGPEDRDLSERCLMFSGVGPPMLAEPYNNNYQIVQSPGYVSVLAEMNHDVRVIPTGGKVTTPNDVNQWHGVSHGRWEGDTLVVETTNIRFNNQSHFGAAYRGMSDENLRVTERFARTDAETIMYQATVDDPSVYTKPWTIEEALTRTKGPLFEYACHEGNYAMPDILKGARLAEQAGNAK
jgi:hypothetical protein